MDSSTFIIIMLMSLLGGGVGVTLFFVIRMIIAPQKVQGLVNLVKQGKSTQSIRLAKQMLSKDPRNIDVHYLL
nr:restriction endonuclease [Spirochaetaceae bacterium]